MNVLENACVNKKRCRRRCIVQALGLNCESPFRKILFHKCLLRNKCYLGGKVIFLLLCLFIHVDQIEWMFYIQALCVMNEGISVMQVFGREMQYDRVPPAHDIELDQSSYLYSIAYC